MPGHSNDYLEAVLQGLKETLERQDRAMEKFLENYDEDKKTTAARMGALEANMAHDRATRAAWNQLIGFIGASLIAATTFFSGAFSHWFGK